MDPVENPDLDSPPELMSVSLSTVVGIDGPKTLKLVGGLAGHEVVVMVDPGATHNFISNALVRKLQLEVKLTHKFGVILGMGTTTMGHGVCERVELELGEFTLIEQFFLLELGNSDLILGVQWFEKLGLVTTN